MSYLHRATYKTDYVEGEDAGWFSHEIPDSALAGRQVLGVDWSTPGIVEVTFLISGKSPVDV